MRDFWWGWFAGAVFGYGLRCWSEYLDDIKGDVFCYEWPRCWKRATHYIEIEQTPLMDEGMCEHHAHKRLVDVLTDADVEADVSVVVCSLSEAIKRARVHRALHPFDGESD